MLSLATKVRKKWERAIDEVYDPDIRLSPDGFKFVLNQ